MRWSERKHTWHQWFAWYPVKINETWVWLEVVYRQRTLIWPQCNYRLLEDWTNDAR